MAKLPKDFFRCRYCKHVHHIKNRTRDHVVPQWAIRAFPEMGLTVADAKGENTVLACRDCNEKKGSIPVAIFLRVKDDPRALYEARCEWDNVARIFGSGGRMFGDEQGIITARTVVAAYTARPGHGGL